MNSLTISVLKQLLSMVSRCASSDLLLVERNWFVIKWIITTSVVFGLCYPSLSNPLMVKHHTVHIVHEKHIPELIIESMYTLYIYGIYARSSNESILSLLLQRISLPLTQFLWFPLKEETWIFHLKNSPSLSQSSSWGACASCYFSHLLCCWCCSLAPFPQSTEKRR